MSLRESIVLPGSQSVHKLDIRPIKDAMRSGNGFLDDSVRSAFQEFSQGGVPKHCVEAMWTSDPAKGYRNAYASLVTEQLWPGYVADVDGENLGRLYTLDLGSDGRSRLIETEISDAVPSSMRPLMLGAYHEMTLVHHIFEQFADGRVPEVSADQGTNARLLEDFKLLTDVGRQYEMYGTGNMPPHIPTPAAFIARAVRAVRTQLYGLPSLVTDQAQRRGLDLSPAQHRAAVVRSLRSAVSPYYLPTFPLLDDIRAATTTGEGSDALNPDSYSSMGEADELMVFVNPDIVRTVNRTFEGRTDVASQTNCPVYSAQVTDSCSPVSPRPFARSLSNLALAQLDHHFYPKYKQEYEAGQVAKAVFSLPKR